MKKIQSILDNNNFKKYIKANVAAEKNRKFCGHDLDHALSVARIAYIIFLEASLNNKAAVKAEGSLLKDKEAIYAAALLHDIGRSFEYKNPKLDHAKVSADLADKILKEAKFSLPEITKIKQLILDHRQKGTLMYKADKASRMCWRCDVQKECYWQNKNDYIKY